MDWLGRYDLLIEMARQGDFYRFNIFIDELMDAGLSSQELTGVTAHIVKSYDGASCSIRATILSMLLKLDEEVACKVAKDSLEEAYVSFRNHGSLLHQIIFCMARRDDIKIATSSIEHDKNMRIAFALMNNLSVEEFSRRN